MFVPTTVKNPFLRVRNEGRTLNIVTNFIIIIVVVVQILAALWLPLYSVLPVVEVTVSALIDR